ncbi:MAG: ATP-binding protein [Streptosporangiaceae bacterium]
MTELTEQSFQRLLEAAPDAILCVAGDGQIVLVNAQAERLFGYPRQELLGQPLELLVPDEARIRPAQHRPGYAARPHTRPMGVGLELAGRRRDGSVFPAEVSLAAIDTDSGLLITAAVRDVTERLAAQSERERLKTQAERDRLERQLQQSQRLNSLGELAGGVAHDFNNLLGVISSYAAFAAEDVPEQAPPECWQALRADLEQVERAAGRAAELTHQLLSFARREVAQRQVLNLHEVVAGVEQLLQRTLGEHVDLATVPGRDLSPVLADPGQIEQVLVNLAINARDAMPAGGRLTIETGNVDVDEVYAASRAELAAGRYVSLRVSDTGTGMTAQVVDRAFEPFYTTKPKGEGTGLGLASVYGIITQAGGNVRIYSEPGLGTTVVVLLPVTDQAMTGPAGPLAAPERGHGEAVLVVEDEPALREVTRRILARNGYQVTVVAGGQDAVDLASAPAARVDALITDVVMPGMQGREVAERVRAVQPGVRVLYMSGYPQGLLGAQGVLESEVSLIEKPFSETTLLAGLRTVLGGRP